jgi:hypothetical protein
MDKPGLYEVRSKVHPYVSEPVRIEVLAPTRDVDVAAAQLIKAAGLFRHFRAKHPSRLEVSEADAEALRILRDDYADSVYAKYAIKAIGPAPAVVLPMNLEWFLGLIGVYVVVALATVFACRRRRGRPGDPRPSRRGRPG